MQSSTSLPPLGAGSSVRRSTQLSNNSTNGQPPPPLQLQQQRPARAHQQYLQRPGSVEGDIYMLTNLRRRMELTHEMFDHLLQEEHQHRHNVDEECEHRWKTMMSMWTSGSAQVRYREELREKVKVQSALTEKVHALFEVSMLEEKIQKAKKKEDDLAKKRIKAQRIRNARPVDLRPRRSAAAVVSDGNSSHAANNNKSSNPPSYLIRTSSPGASADGDMSGNGELGEETLHRSTTNFLAQPTCSPEMDMRYATTQAQRAEDHHRRYKCDISKKISVALRAAAVREEETIIRRERIVQRAIGLHDNRRRVKDARRAQSLTPTAFLQLPPLREVFADDVLAFDAPTLMSRHYHSTYRPSGGVEDGRGMLMASTPEGGGGGAVAASRAPLANSSERSHDVGIGTE
jgi:hypothetical protein